MVFLFYHPAVQDDATRWVIPSLLSKLLVVYKYGVIPYVRIRGGGPKVTVAALPFFVGRCILCEVTLFSGGGRPRSSCSNRGDI